MLLLLFFSSRRRHTRCALVTGVQTCALPIFFDQFVKLPTRCDLDLLVGVQSDAMSRVEESVIGESFRNDGGIVVSESPPLEVCRLVDELIETLDIIFESFPNLEIGRAHV